MLYVYAQKQILINFNNMTCWLNSFEIHANFYHCTLQHYIFIIYIFRKNTIRITLHSIILHIWYNPNHNHLNII